MALTLAPALIAACTRRSPGSEIPGVPASETTATSCPADNSSTTRLASRCSVCSLHTARARAVTPRCCSSRPVRRVSSQHTSADCSSVSRARGVMSPRLPIGVATSHRVPVIGSPMYRVVDLEIRVHRRREAPSERRLLTQPQRRTQRR